MGPVKRTRGRATARAAAAEALAVAGVVRRPSTQACEPATSSWRRSFARPTARRSAAEGRPSSRVRCAHGGLARRHRAGGQRRPGDGTAARRAAFDGRRRRRHGVGLAGRGGRRPAVRRRARRRRHARAGVWRIRACSWTGHARCAALRRAAPALSDVGRRRRRPRRSCWPAPRSFCAGVERAIEIVERALERAARRCTCASRSSTTSTSSASSSVAGRSSSTSSTRCPTARPWSSPPTASRRRCASGGATRGLDVIDATCPLVAKVHAEARRFAAAGKTIVLIGHADHEEVEGTTGRGARRDPARRARRRTWRTLEVRRPGRRSPTSRRRRSRSTRRPRWSTRSARPLPRPRRARAPTTSATRRRTARRRCRRSPASATSCSSSARTTRPTRTGWSRWPSARGRRPTWSTTSASSTRRGSPARARSGSPPARRRPSSSSSAWSSELGALGPVEVDGAAGGRGAGPVHPAARRCADDAIPLRQSLRVGGYLLRQKLQRTDEVPADRRARAAVRRATWPARAAGRSSTRSTSCASGCRSSRRLAAIEECGAPMVSIAGGEPLVHPEIARDGARADPAQASSSSSARTRSCCRRSSTCSRRRRTSPGSSTSTGCGSATTSPSSARASSTRRSRRSATPRRAASASPPTRRSSTPTPRRPCATCSTSCNDELEVDDMMISPAYAYEKAPDQEHFLGVAADPQAVPRGVRRRPPQALAAEPHAALPRLPRGQGRLRVHGVGDPELLGLRLAAAVLPDGRRLRRDLPGAGRDDRLGAVRPRQGRRAAPTAWRTAATSRPRCCTRCRRSASPCAPPSRVRRLS